MARFDFKVPTSLHVWTNHAVDWVIAKSAADACAVMKEFTRGDAEDEDEDWERMEPRKPVKVRMGLCDYKPEDDPEGCRVSIEYAELKQEGSHVLVTDGIVYVEAAAEAWATKNGRGLLCSENFR